MNEPIAVNQFTLTKELFYEGNKRTGKETYSRFALRMVLIMTGAWMIIAVVTLLTRPSIVFLAVEALVLILASLWVAVYTPWRKRKKAYNAFLELYGEDPARTTVFYVDRLVVNPEGREITVAYSDITKTLMSDRLLIFITSANKGILIKRDSFTTGTEETVLCAVNP
ncbi:MAG: YcxB family protein [Clostridia bacterium]|nr:YcxB family protein [Clostridia bacterium]